MQTCWYSGPRVRDSGPPKGRVFFGSRKMGGFSHMTLKKSLFAALVGVSALGLMSGTASAHLFGHGSCGSWGGGWGGSWGSHGGWGSCGSYGGSWGSCGSCGGYYTSYSSCGSCSGGYYSSYGYSDGGYARVSRPVA